MQYLRRTLILSLLLIGSATFLSAQEPNPTECAAYGPYRAYKSGLHHSKPNGHTLATARWTEPHCSDLLLGM